MTVPGISPVGPNGPDIRPSLGRMPSVFPSFPASPVVAAYLSDEWVDGVLELTDGSSYRGISFGAQGKSISGECVFQTGLNFCIFFGNVSYNLKIPMQAWLDTLNPCRILPMKARSLY
jgi:hypothetical protein